MAATAFPPPPTPRPLRAVVPVRVGDTDRLQAMLGMLAGNATIAAMRFSFIATAQIANETRAAIERALPGQGAAWEIEEDRGDGFAVALAAAAARDPESDLVLLSSHVQLPFAWDARLRKAAYASKDVGAVIPLCDISPLSALLDAESGLPAGGDAALVDRAAYSLGMRSYYEVPRLHTACAYLRREAFDAAMPHVPGDARDEQSVLDALARHIRVRGWSCVVCDFLYVGYDGPAQAKALGDVEMESQAFVQHHPLGGLRRAMKDAIGRGLPALAVPGLDHRPVQLHIMHFWGGGLDKWVRDFGRSDPARVNMILSSYRIGNDGGQRIVLYSDPAARIPIRTWDIARPIRSSVSSSLEYRRILGQVIAEYDVEAIVVSSLIGHSLDALTQARKTIVVCHDFHPVCQAVNPLFGKVCERCTREDLRLCAQTNPLNRFFTDQTPDEWHEMRTLYVDHLIAHRVEMVAPSRWVAAELRRLDPRLEAVTIHVVPHGIDLDAPKLPFPLVMPGERLRIVVMGRLNVQKGLDLLRGAARELGTLAEITLVGCGPMGAKLAQEHGWNHVESYEPEALPDLLREIAPHLGLLPSVVPETFSYTLSELQALGVPPLATALGAFRERIVEGETGFLFDPTVESLLARIGALRAAPRQLEAVARTLEDLKGTSVREMVERYHSLVPLGPRPVARFPVGIGSQSALTEPYRHLDEAYAELTGAYGQLSAAYAQSTDAYGHTKTAYEQAHEELEEWRAKSEALQRELDALEVGPWRWWNYPKVVRFIRGLREKNRTGQ
jgi:glycosyltransferase involved in cell wall biosynthesis